MQIVHWKHRQSIGARSRMGILSFPYPRRRQDTPWLAFLENIHRSGNKDRYLPQERRVSIPYAIEPRIPAVIFFQSHPMDWSARVGFLFFCVFGCCCPPSSFQWDDDLENDDLDDWIQISWGWYWRMISRIVDQWTIYFEKEKILNKKRADDVNTFSC